MILNDELMKEYTIYQNDSKISLSAVARKLKVSSGFVKTHFATLENVIPPKRSHERHPLFPNSKTSSEVFDQLIKEYEICQNDANVNYSAIARKLNVSSWFVTTHFASLGKMKTEGKICTLPSWDLNY